MKGEFILEALEFRPLLKGHRWPRHNHLRRLPLLSNRYMRKPSGGTIESSLTGAIFGEGLVTVGEPGVLFSGLEPVYIAGANAGADANVDGQDLPSSLTFTTPNGADNTFIDSTADGRTRISASSGEAEDVIFSNVPHVVVDAATNDCDGSEDDAITIVSVSLATGLQTFQANTGDGDNTGIGPDCDSRWVIGGDDIDSVAAVTFSGVANLTAGSEDDRYVFGNSNEAVLLNSDFCSNKKMTDEAIVKI